MTHASLPTRCLRLHALARGLIAEAERMATAPAVLTLEEREAYLDGIRRAAGHFTDAANVLACATFRIEASSPRIMPP